jgi:uncharacterized protein YndB with AHSA1/START domain
MTNPAESIPAAERELVITRLIDAPRDKVFRAWTEPTLLERWFCPRPWRAEFTALDLRPGGVNRVVMHGPDGEEMAHTGVYLEIVENEKLVFTDAFTEGWVPSEKPFMTAVITLADEGGKTRYTARALHWSVEDRETHEKMGFHEGWAKCAEQLEQVARDL